MDEYQGGPYAPLNRHYGAKDDGSEVRQEENYGTEELKFDDPYGKDYFNQSPNLNKNTIFQVSEMQNFSQRGIDLVFKSGQRIKQDQTFVKKYRKNKKDNNTGLKKLSSCVYRMLKHEGQLSQENIAKRLIDDMEDEITRRNKGYYQDIEKDKKNIKRRIYDAINVMVAIDLLKRQNKQIKYNHDDAPLPPKPTLLEPAELNLAPKHEHKLFLKQLKPKLKNLLLRNRISNGKGNKIGLPLIILEMSKEAECKVQQSTHAVKLNLQTDAFELKNEKDIMQALQIEEQDESALRFEINQSKQKKTLLHQFKWPL